MLLAAATPKSATALAAVAVLEAKASEALASSLELLLGTVFLFRMSFSFLFVKEQGEKE